MKKHMQTPEEYYNRHPEEFPFLRILLLVIIHGLAWIMLFVGWYFEVKN